MGDAVFYSALLNSPADVSVSVGGVVQLGTWSDAPDSKSGLYHGNMPFDDLAADVVVSLTRNGNVFATGTSTATSPASDTARVRPANRRSGAGSGGRKPGLHRSGHLDEHGACTRRRLLAALRRRSVPLRTAYAHHAHFNDGGSGGSGSSRDGSGDESRAPSRASNYPTPTATPTATSPSGPCMAVGVSILVQYNDNSASGEA
ncbi:d1eb6a7a-d2c3-4a74-add6-62781f3fd77b [Thermothielavioides terrestris]|uniref:D1eb6a7a-d2c3-4a74-add6-62781f3fd77b n=1 Tax=Thermothielavioides terrestris TaxID=2587410 RepID=A0A3S4CA24_9PEZI|nr:d1eb6a7a-d2c3-4a74-add6-62781f3fd77b [Thermothielavioides terrestris]